METIYFEDALDFAVSVDSMYENVLNKADLADISIIAKYKEANEIIKSLIKIGEYDIYSFDNFINPNHSPEEYSDEYIISIMNCYNLKIICIFMKCFSTSIISKKVFIFEKTIKIFII